MGPRAGLDGRKKSRPLLGFDPSIAQPAASHYTDRAIPAHRNAIRTHQLATTFFMVRCTYVLNILLGIGQCYVRWTFVDKNVNNRAELCPAATYCCCAWK